MTLAEAWARLELGAKDRRSGFHTCAVATISAGRPSLRTVVLRGSSAASWTLRFHTDTRAPKTEDILRSPHVALLFYDPAAKIQLRAQGLARIEADGPPAEAAWAASKPMSRICYRTDLAPGTMMDSPYAVNFSGAGPEAGRENFCAVTVEVTALEWLYLAHAGHRRALFERKDGALSSHWLAP